MNIEDLYTYIGCVIILVLIYLIYKTLNQKTTPEGFMGMFKDTDGTKTDTKTDTTPEATDSDDPSVKRIEENVKRIVDETNTIIKKMNLVKYRSHWEDLIVAMEDRISSVSLQALSPVGDMLKTDPNSDRFGTIIDKLNQLNKFRETLKDNMRYLDGLK
jgi:CBS-domain-containing membrane protein